jgi:hypothetical protein
MATYIISKNTRTEIQNQFQDYFDPTDQEKWTELLKIMKNYNSVDIISKFPDLVSNDLNLWLELYKFVPNSAFPIENEELSSTSTQMQLVSDPDDDSRDYVEITIDS